VANFAEWLAKIVRETGDFDVNVSHVTGQQFVARCRQTTCDRLIAFGSDETIATISRDISPDVTFEGHGHGFGIVVLDAVASRDIATAVAEDIAWYEQLGCLSPQCVFVHGAAATGFCTELHTALNAVNARWPAPRPDRERAFAIRAWLGSVGTQAVKVLRSDSNVVMALDQTALTASPGHRTIAVSPFSAKDDLERVLRPCGQHITTVATNEPSLLPDVLGSARIVEPGRMQIPPFDGWEDPRPPKIKRR
jgi:hypothetical protein